MAKRDYTKTYEKRSQTQDRHSHMRCITRELEIKPRSQAKRDYLDRIFTEGKWLTNYYIQLHKEGRKWSDMPTKDNGVIVKYPFGYEMRTLYAIPSSAKQGIQKRLRENEKSIITNIKEGNITHGEMHYISDLASIPLPAGNWQGDKAQSYTLHKDRKHVTFQGDKRVFRVIGGEQVPQGAELANAKLIRKEGKYFLHVTFFVEWEEGDAPHTDEQVAALANALDGTGLDFGIETNVTESEGEKHNWWFDETERLKAAQAANEAYRKNHRRAFGWERNSNRQLRIINDEYAKIARKKKRAIDVFVHDMRSRGGIIAVQDEQIRSWHSDERYSEMVQHSILGGIMQRLKAEPSTLSVSKWTRTTGVCPDCGHVLEEKLGLDVREWDCPACGVHHDRDVAAARAILELAVVSALYPVRPDGLDEGTFCSLLGVLGLDRPVMSDCLDRVG